VLGGHSPIISVLVGHEEQAFRAGKFLFDRWLLRPISHLPGSAVSLRPCCEFRSIRTISPKAIDGFLEAMADLKACIPLPSPDEIAIHSAAGVGLKWDR